jgi:SulP family sulfate permease
VIDDPEEVIVDFRESKISDMSAIDAVHKLTERYAKAGKKLHLRYLSDCRQLLHAADDVIDINIIEDPTYKVVSN